MSTNSNKAVERILETAAKSVVSYATSLPFPPSKCGHLITEDQAERLLQLNLSQQMSLIELAPYFVRVEVDEAALNKSIDKVVRDSELRELENDFLNHGAPATLMKYLFGIQNNEFSRRRAALNLKHTGTGRPKKCSEETEKRIFNAWNASDQETSEATKLLFVAKTTRLDLHLVWQVLSPEIQDCDKPASK